MDIVATKDGKRIAVEVETGNSDALGNIWKCLNAGFYFVICLTTEERLANKTRELAENSGVDTAKVRILEVSEALW